MARRAGLDEAVAAVGYAVRPDGAGVAYAILAGALHRGPEVLRVSFACTPLPAFKGRDVAYAAVTQIAAEFARRGDRVATFEVVDERLVADLAERRSLPQALAIPYVALRCQLNRLDGAAVVLCADGRCRDLEARARAEVSVAVAA